MAYRSRYYLAYGLERALFAKQRLWKLCGRPLFSSIEYGKMKKLNLACSDRIIPGWINVDIRALEGVDHVVDVKDLSVFPDNSFDIVRASHILEHFYCDELEIVLKEWARVLKPGGWMQVCVPDFTLTVVRYLLNPHSINPLLEPEFGTAIPAQIYGFGYTSKENLVYKHRIVFNRRSLAVVMKTFAALTNIKPFNYLREEPYLSGILDDSTNVYSLNLAGQKE